MRIYLDNCCYNRPFDNQRDLVIALETFAKLQIQAMMRSGAVGYVWSGALSHEAADYTQWRQTQFEDMSLEELDAATRASGEHVRRVLATEKTLNRIS